MPIALISSLILFYAVLTISLGKLLNTLTSRAPEMRLRLYNELKMKIFGLFQ